MKTLTAIILLQLPTLVCIIFAGYLMVLGKDGWGWLLFIGCLLSGGSYKSSDKDKK